MQTQPGGTCADKSKRLQYGGMEELELVGCADILSRDDAGNLRRRRLQKGDQCADQFGRRGGGGL